MKVLGMMTGTSMDGIDCIILNIKYINQNDIDFDIIEKKTFPIPITLRNEISSAVKNPHIDYTSLHKKLGSFYLLSICKMKELNNLDIIAFHGQTIYHKEKVKSIQIGDPDPISKEFNIPVICNFRKADIDVGGTGAPLMPFLDWLILKKSGFDDITLNIGGISNITYIPFSGQREDVIGFDTGPGMSLIDEMCLKFWNKPYDKNGKISKKGSIDLDILDELMDHPFINLEYPKSTGRDIFGINLVNKIIQKYHNVEPYNILRTFVAFTAKSISVNIQKIRNFLSVENRLIISGGGLHHPLLIDDLKTYSGIKNIYDSTIIDINPDYKEAILIALLGFTRLKQISNNMPSVTGANEKISLGEIFV